MHTYHFISFLSYHFLFFLKINNTAGYMIKTGYAREVYITSAVRHIMMKTGILGIKVSIMHPNDPTGIKGPKIPLADSIVILDPKE